MRGKRAKWIRRQIAALAAEYKVEETRKGLPFLTMTTVKRVVTKMIGANGSEHTGWKEVALVTRWGIGFRRLYRLSKMAWRRHRRLATRQEYYGPLAQFNAARKGRTA